MIPICKAFDRYLDDTQRFSIGLRGLVVDVDDCGNCDGIDAVELRREYLHRHTHTYAKSRLAKLYRLKDYYEENPPPKTMMITYTGEHDSPRWRRKHGLGYMDWIPILRTARTKSRKVITHHQGHSLSYLDMWEGHPSSGYAHIHALYFGDIKDDLPDKIKKHYDSLGIADTTHGINIDCRIPEDFSNIRSFIGYPMAYIGGSLIDTLNEWTVQDLIFNASTWATRPRIRTFQPSRDLSRVMAYHRPSNQQYIHIETYLDDDALSTDEVVLHRSKHYEMNIKTWRQFNVNTS